MSIDIHAIRVGDGNRKQILPETRIELPGGGVWEFLEDYFTEVERKTGIDIDPYGDSYFHPDQLNLLLLSMDKAKKDLEKMPKMIRVVLGQEGKKGSDIFATVGKSEILLFISRFQDLLKRSMEKRLMIGFTGD